MVAAVLATARAVVPVNVEHLVRQTVIKIARLLAVNLVKAVLVVVILTVLTHVAAVVLVPLLLA